MESCDNCNENCEYLEKCLTPEQLGEGVKFERIRRCTGYLSGDYETRFNNAKRAEVEDRMTAKKRVEQYHEVKYDSNS